MRRSGNRRLEGSKANKILFEILLRIGLALGGKKGGGGGGTHYILLYQRGALGSPSCKAKNPALQLAGWPCSLPLLTSRTTASCLPVFTATSLFFQALTTSRWGGVGVGDYGKGFHLSTSNFLSSSALPQFSVTLKQNL